MFKLMAHFNRAGRSPLAVVAVILLVGLNGCWRARTELWPPKRVESTVTVHVYATAMHSLISLPMLQDGTTTSSVREWAFGQRIWFYEDRYSPLEGTLFAMHRMLGVLRAAFWPSTGVIEITRDRIAYPEREGLVEFHHWEFKIGEEGQRRLLRYLEESYDPAAMLLDDPPWRYYVSSRRYWSFNTCHHYVGRGLREAGLPIGTWRCVVPWGLWWQLDRLERLQERAAH